MAAERYFVRERREQAIFRDEKGRFVSREKGLREGVVPQIVTQTIFTDKKGRFVSEEKVKRSKRKIVDVVRDQEGNIKEALKIRGEVLKDPVFVDVLGQQARGIILESITSGDKIGFLWKGRLYVVKPERYGKLQQAWNEISNLAVDVFKASDSLYYTVSIAEGLQSLVIDFDSVVPTDRAGDKLSDSQMDVEFQRGAEEILKNLY